jgi:hypothetical protein
VKEKVFNVFLFVEDAIIIGLGARCHHADGSDREKIAFLQRQVKHDLAQAERFPIPTRYRLVFSDGRIGTGSQYQCYLQLALLQRHLELFEEVFIHYQAPDSPLMCITPIVGGKPRADAVTQD